MRESVGVIILSWNDYADTARCLRTVLANEHAGAFPVLVDNASSDGSYERLREEFPDVEAIRAPRNLGYAGGNNLGIRRAMELGAEHVYVINNDTEVPIDSLAPLLEVIRADPRVAQVGPRIDDATCGRIGAVGGEVNWPYAEPRQIGHGEDDQGQYRDLVDSEYVPGTAVLTRCSAIADVGLIPEEYFIYFEDVDWSLRFRAAGWKTVVEPRSRIVHWESSTMGRRSPVKWYYQVRNNLAFIDAWVPGARRAAVRRNFHRKLLKLMVKELLHGSLRQLRAMIDGYADFRASRLGRTERRW